MWSAPSRVPSRLLLVAGALALLLATVWLRAPTFGFRVWNVDEAIHAAVARTLLDGGVLYRDAIDQRTPLTYGVMAALFGLAGVNNFVAVHVFTALLIAATALLLLLTARRLAGTGAGVWVAILYVALATGQYYQGDANAFVTEWFVAFFSSAGAWLFWSSAGAAAGPVRRLLTGGMFGLAALSKQPGALDLAAPVLTLAWLRFRAPAAARRPQGLEWAALLTGFCAPLVLTAAYYAGRGALTDLVFYTWTYNLRFYGPEISLADRLASAGVPFRLLAAFSPLLLGVFLAAALGAGYRLLRRPPAANGPASAAGEFYVVVWGLSSLAGAASGGRGFDHYSIQFLPVLCLGTGWLLGSLTGFVGRGPGRPLLRLAGAALLLVLGAGLIAHTAAARRRTLPADPSRRVAAFIAERSAPADRIFVWGYHPDVYLFTNRRPASRFVYASFLTGLIPWTNVAPGRDTAYAIVPGAMETLRRDLERSRPVFIVDCSAGPNRHWDKYPLAQFPPLAEFIHEHYVVIEEATFVPQGFRLYAIKDSFRAAPAPLPEGPTALGRAGHVEVSITPVPEGQPCRVSVRADDSAGRLCRLEVLLDGARLVALTLGPGPELVANFETPLAPHTGRHRVQARAICADGAAFASVVRELDSEPSLLPAADLPAFALAVGPGLLAPIAGSAPFGASAGREEGRMIFFAHAPSLLRYPLPPGTRAVLGGMGFRPGAYAPDNLHATDGAEFQVVWIPPTGSAQVIFRQLLRPVANPADRGVVPFRAELPPGAAGQVQFVIDPGPAGDSACDWTYWADLTLESSR